MVKVLRVGEPVALTQVNHPQQARRFWDRVIKKQTWFDANKEHLVVLLLSTKADLQGYSLISIGTLSESLAHPREIFRSAVAAGCYGIIVMHNHPSGDPWPSETDRQLTLRLSEAANILQIKLLDHVVVGKPRAHKLNTFPERPRRGRPAKWQAVLKREQTNAIREGYFSFKEHSIL